MLVLFRELGKKGGKEALTGTETALVDPGVHVRALVFKGLDVKVFFFELGLQAVDLVFVGLDGVVKGAR